MGNTYYQMYIQVVFAVYKRKNLIHERHRDEIEKYMTGIMRKRNVKTLAIYCNPDHCHLFIAPPANVSLSTIVRDVKAFSSKFINHNLFGMAGFSWQSGYGAFSYSKSQIKTVGDYVLNQKNHHQRQSFKDEYITFLDRFNIEYDKRYLFEWYY
jgi:REP element-mobilizing transposase RayT